MKHLALLLLTSFSVHLYAMERPLAATTTTGTAPRSSISQLNFENFDLDNVIAQGPAKAEQQYTPRAKALIDAEIKREIENSVVEVSDSPVTSAEIEYIFGRTDHTAQTRMMIMQAMIRLLQTNYDADSRIKLLKALLAAEGVASEKNAPAKKIERIPAAAAPTVADDGLDERVSLSSMPAEQRKEALKIGLEFVLENFDKGEIFMEHQYTPRSLNMIGQVAAEELQQANSTDKSPFKS